MSRDAGAAQGRTAARLEPVCRCGHPAVSHGLTHEGARTGCSVHTGPQGTPCGCRRYQPADPEAVS